MAGMSPLLDRLGIGPLRLDTESGTEWFSIEEGFAHVRDNTLTILSEAVYSVNVEASRSASMAAHRASSVIRLSHA